MEKRLNKLEASCSGIRKSNDIIHNEVIKIGQDVKYLKSKAKNVADIERDSMDFSDLPFQDIDKLSEFEVKLVCEEGLKEKFIRYLKNLGGVSYKNALQLILRKIVAPELGMRYSMRGRADKLKFGDLTMYKCVTG